MIRITIESIPFKQGEGKSTIASRLLMLLTNTAMFKGRSIKWISREGIEYKTPGHRKFDVEIVEK